MKRPRKVFGRLRNVEAEGRLWTLELRKDGLFVRPRNGKGWERIQLDQLTAGGGRQIELCGEKWHIVLTDAGLSVRRKHERKSRVVSYATLANCGRDQTLLFAEAK